MLKISKISIKNILGIESSEITPDGNVIEVDGKNGSGKTSTIKAILDALGLSQHSTLLRNGEKKGEVVIDMGDMLVKKSHTEKGSTLAMKAKVLGTKAMTNLSSPAGVLKSIVAPNSIDPVRLLTATNKELVDAVLESIPMTVDQQVMSKILGRSDPYEEGEHALHTIANVSKSIVEHRRDVNRDHKTATTTVEQLTATLPEEGVTSLEINEKITQNKEEMEKITSLARTAKRKARQDAAGNLQKSSESIDIMESKLRDMKADLERYKSDHRDLVNMCEVAEDEAFNKVMEVQEDLVKSNEELYSLLTSSKVAEQTRHQIDQYNLDISDKGVTSNRLSKQLADLQDYKEQLCKDLPIKGLALTDGKLSLNGVPFSTLNTAARVDLVIELAKISSGDLGLVVLDNSECLDKETYAEFIKKAKNTELQWIVARVSDEDLSITS